MIQPLNTVSSTNQADTALAELIEELAGRLRAGEQVDLEGYIALHADCADRLRQLWPTIQVLADLGLSRTGSASPSPSLVDDPDRGTLGDFRITRELGRGGMGVVYEVEQISLMRRVALKVLPFAATMDSRQLQRFQNEARAAASLHHPHIVPVYAVGCERGVHYYAMQYIEGRNLATVIADLRLQISDLRKKEENTNQEAARALPSPLYSGVRGRGEGSELPRSPTPHPQPLSPEYRETAEKRCLDPSDPLQNIEKMQTRRGPDTFFQQSHRGEGRKPDLQSTFCNLQSATLPSIKTSNYFRTAARLGMQAAEALHHAHELGVVHRDIKPANLLLDGHGNMWVTDFGLAQIQGNAQLTMTGDLVGTLRYMSPEQALGKRVEVDHRTDIYSLGATLYEMLTLEPVFAGTDRQELLHQIAFEDPRHPRRHNRAMPEDLETIVLKALEKNPADRYAGAQELANDLRHFLEDRPILARRPSWLQRVRRRARRHQAVVTATALTLALALAVSTGLIWREQGRTLSALHDAEVQRGLAKEREILARRQLYAAHIGAARRAWEVDRLGVVQRLLEQHIPQGGEEDLRGFEWYYLWGLCRGRKETLLTLRGHTGEVYCVQFSPDGKLLATAGQDHTVRLWDLATGGPRAVLRGHNNEVNWAAFSPDGVTLASAGDDGAVKLWDVAAGRETKQLLKAPVPVIGIAFSPDGKLLAAGLSDGTVRWWDLPSEQERRPIRAHLRRIESVTFSPDGRTLATCAENTKLWDAATGQLQQKLVHSDVRVNYVRFGHRGDMVAAASGQSQVQLWNPVTGQELQTFASNATGIAESVAFSPDDQVLASASDDGGVRLFDIRGGKMRDLITGHAGRVWCVAFSPDGRALATAGKDGTVQLWDPAGWQNRKVLAGPLGHYILAFSPDGKRLFGGGKTKLGGLSIWDGCTGRLISSRPSDHVTALALAPNGRTLATGHYNGQVIFWDVDQGQPRLVFQADDRADPTVVRAINDLAFTADGKRLLTDSARCVRQWNAATGTPLGALTETHAVHSSFAYSAASDTIAISTSKGVVLSHLSSGGYQTLPETTNDLSYLTFSPDGNLLAGSNSNNVFLWDLGTGRARPPLLGHRGLNIVITFSPDGRTLATLSENEELKLWSASTGQELLSLEDYGGNIRSVAFSPDGRTLATFSEREGASGEVALWLTPDGPPVAAQGASVVKLRN